MKKLLLASLLSLPCITFAGGLKVPEGNVKQDSCGFVGSDVRQNVWKIEGNSQFNQIVKNKVLPVVGKKIAIGDVLFYVNIAVERSETKYVASSDIVLNGLGWTSSDYVIRKGDRLNNEGDFTNRVTKAKYTLVRINTGTIMNSYAAVKDDGFICSGMINRFNEDGQLDSDDHDVFQKDPLIKQVNVIPSSNNTIGISLVQMDDISLTLLVKQFKNGQVLVQKEIQLDAMSGNIQIDELKIAFAKLDKSTMLIKSIDEPSNYSEWVSRVKMQILKTNN